MFNVFVDNRLPGANSDASSFRLMLSAEQFSVRELIVHTARSQLSLRAILQQQDAQPFLDPAQIDRSVPLGKIALAAPTEFEAEIERCVKAFAARHFQIVIDGTWYRSLDDVVTLHSDSSIVFLRLMPLQGG
jgi:hypothetical protein